MEDIHALERSFEKMFEGVNRLIIVYKEHELSIDDRLELQLLIEDEKMEDFHK